ncbi:MULTISPECIES: hypothetical protein [Ectothiorhodospira]|uniref:Uncharacterized protein n=1 Tax=Ectothiorhodospira haloalkaliphila TaxID=421628 RepID=W8KNK8_9GAMM|nr:MULTISPECIES: hypothetical protein [Ectothiorhodospira]TVQ70316.1 MAG: hypothetical protein EA372_10830 [Chromatiaceae bacterium]AHK80733.1 hypothetical protein M911_11965 [Ectothiorhodospira haloalkaliphila]ANB02245.1 hypothetical protein ECTOBSL9_1591 [Ectothiorhodospira sp. BSL-9]MCG5495369.1 hypothetical protein [Ectothiorhodospira variabilis]MCG5498786.1 hypothetical protein [Ectothiorhodospira variabilis]
MDTLLNILGTLIGLAGLIVCAAVGGTWFMGEYYLMGLELLVVLTGGVALMVAAVLFKVQVLVMRSF